MGRRKDLNQEKNIVRLMDLTGDSGAITRKNYKAANTKQPECLTARMKMQKAPPDRD